MNSTSRINLTSSQLVKSLYSFGLEDPEASTSTLPIRTKEEEEGLDDLDGEEEEIIVGGIKGDSKSNQEKEEKDLEVDNVKGKGKATKGKKGKKVSSEVKLPVQELDLLALDSSSTTIPAPPKPIKSLKGLLRSTVHTITVPGVDGKLVKRELTSWKMADYAYKRDPCPFPTRARGLFTEKIEKVKNVIENGEEEKEAVEDEYRIIARGYDKFFNVGEVSWTHWKTIPLASTAPYELTLKSNGCIILIAALSPTQILVTSKHSIGTNINLAGTSGVSHSERGEYWLEIHLSRVGKTKEDLAKKLWEEAWTAVAELCDDTFEEHVLPYPPALTGLHLHGLNLNTPILYSLPSSTVTSFANTFGFLPTPYQVFETVESVKEYCDKVQETGGIWEEDSSTPEGKKLIPVEGFVVRGLKSGGRVGEPFFWKVKFDEPYLMYREWREITRKLLQAAKKQLVVEEERIKKEITHQAKKVQGPGQKAFDEKFEEPVAEEEDTFEIDLSKVRNQESRLYAFWVNREISRDLDSFDSWSRGKGIIATRERFLEWRSTEEGKSEGSRLGSKFVEEELRRERLEGTFDKTLIVPIAIQGCGKTALGLELSHLFGWGHTQSDDITVKKAGPPFIKKVKELLGKHDVVFADKNNHVRKLRSDLIQASTSLLPKQHVRLIALLWNLDSPGLPRDKVHAICASRIVSRGHNHQTLRAGEGHESAIWQFFAQYEQFDQVTNKDDSKFNEVIEMRLEWDQKETLVHTVNRLVEILGIEKPSEERIEEALEFARNYTPSVRKEVSAAKLAKALAPRYYGIAVEQDLAGLLNPLFLYNSLNIKGLNIALYSHLYTAKRIELNPHITLVHEVELTNPDPEFASKKQLLWNHYSSLVSNAALDGSGSLEVDIELGPRVFWDKRVMSIEVSKITSVRDSNSSTADSEEGKEKENEGEDSQEVETKFLEQGKGSAHITVGTIETSIRPIEGKLIVKAFEDGKKATIDGGKIMIMDIGIVKCKGKVMGMK